MKISSVIALLLAPASATKLQQTVCSDNEIIQATTLAQQEQFMPSMPPMPPIPSEEAVKQAGTEALQQIPSAEAIQRAGIQALQQLGRELRQSRRELQSTFKSTQHLVGEAANQLGAGFSQSDAYPSGFLADMIIAEYEQVVQDVYAQKDGAQNLLHEIRRGVNLAQTEQPMRPSEYCNDPENSPISAVCELKQNLPPVHMILDGWIQVLDNVHKQFADHQEMMERDIASFNQMLLMEAERQGVKVSANLPDPKQLTAKLGKLFQGLSQVANQNRDQIIQQVEYLENNIAMQIGYQYSQLAQELGNATGFDVPSNRLPTPIDMMNIGTDVLTVLKEANQSRDATHLYGNINDLNRNINDLMQSAGLDSHQAPSPDQMQVMVSGLLDSGLQQIEEDRQREMRRNQ